MVRRWTYAVASVSMLGMLVAGCGSSDGTHRVAGSSADAFGGTFSTWAELDGNDLPVRVGVTAPLSALNAASRARHGDGPAGADVVINYPAEVQANSIFNHFEMHFEPAGHPPPVFQVPHFDMHCYAVPEADVRAVTPTNTNVPAADRFSAGYSSPANVEEYQAGIVPEMGYHSVLLSQIGSDTFDATMVLGYYDGRLTFMEPMITQAKLALQQSFSVPVVLPTTFGFTTRVPRQFNAVFNAATNSYDLIWSDFVLVN